MTNRSVLVMVLCCVALGCGTVEMADADAGADATSTEGSAGSVGSGGAGAGGAAGTAGTTGQGGSTGGTGGGLPVCRFQGVSATAGEACSAVCVRCTWDDFHTPAPSACTPTAADTRICVPSCAECQ
jgi:hypothetical protein